MAGYENLDLFDLRLANRECLEEGPQIDTSVLYCSIHPPLTLIRKSTGSEGRIPFDSEQIIEEAVWIPKGFWCELVGHSQN